VEQEFQGTQTINRAAQLLTLVIESEQPRALTELADDAALPKSTTSRLLGALEREGLIQQQGRRGRFEPGPVLRRYANRGQLGELAQPHHEVL
jgi:IclR family acetate operon transcriptional repressor